MDDRVMVLSTFHFDEQQLDRLRAVSPRLHVVQHTTRQPEEVPAELWAEAEVLCTVRAVPEPDRAPRLRWVQLLSAGADHVMDRPMFDGDVALTTTSGIHAPNMGEYVLGLMLSWTYQLPRALDLQRRPKWPEQATRVFRPRELRDQTVGIVGYGSVGREVGRLARAFHMRVLALKRTEGLEDEGYVVPGAGDPEGRIPDRFYHLDQLHEMLPRCDFVVLGVPLTRETRHLIGKQELQAMKPSAFLINVARGPVVDEAALVEGLVQGWIAGAGLDVFAQEPLPASHPLWDLRNVILTPHIAGSTQYYNQRAADVCVENLERYLEGRPLVNRVDRDRGY